MSESTKNPPPAVQSSPAAGQDATGKKSPRPPPPPPRKNSTDRDLAAAGPSSSSTIPPPEMSSTEVASASGSLTPVNLCRVSFPRARPEERVAGYLNSMNATLPRDQNLDLTHDQPTNDQKLEAAHGTQPSMAGPGPVGRSSDVSPFVSSLVSSIPPSAIPSAVKPGDVSSEVRSCELGPANVSTVMSKVFDNFKTRLDLRGLSPALGLPPQAHAGPSSHPTFEAGTGFASSTDVPSARVPLDQFLRPLKAGDMPRPRPNLAGVPRSFVNKDTEQVCLLASPFP